MEKKHFSCLWGGGYHFKGNGFQISFKFIKKYTMFNFKSRIQPLLWIKIKHTHINTFNPAKLDHFALLFHSISIYSILQRTLNIRNCQKLNFLRYLNFIWGVDIKTIMQRKYWITLTFIIQYNPILMSYIIIWWYFCKIVLNL